MNTQTKKSLKAKMSQFGKSGNWRHPKGGKALRRIALLFVLLLVALSLVAAFLWHNRTNLAENQIRKFMAQNGYEASLDVTKLSKEQITITNIKVRKASTANKNSSDFFKAAKMVVDYDLNARKVLRAELIKPYLNVEIDTQGHINSSWLNPNTGNNQNLTLPPDGINIEDANIDWRIVQTGGVHIGAGRANVTAQILSRTNWTANILGHNAAFKSQILSASLQHDIFVKTKDGKTIDVFGSLSGQKLRTELLPLKSLQTETVMGAFNLNVERSNKTDSFAIKGWSEVHIAGLISPNYASENIDLKIENIHFVANELIAANWQIKSKGTRISNEDMRTGLANRATAHNVMTNTPIAQYFTETHYVKTKQMLNGFALQGSGKITYNPTGYIINLDQPLNLASPNQTVTFKQPTDAFVQYNNKNQLITVLAEHIYWSGEKALKLNNFVLKAESNSGMRIDAVKHLNAHIRSLNTWHALGKDTQMRLAPFDIDFSYDDYGSARRILRLSGPIDYDGFVPGGFVRGLKAGGEMNVHIRGREFDLDFTPFSRLRIGAFTNASGWTTKSLTFALEPQKSLLQKTAQANVLRATLSNVRSNFIGPEDKRHLEARFERLDVIANFAKSPKQWQIQVSGGDIKSEDFPAPGTHIVTARANLDVLQSNDGKITFDISSPVTHVVTDNATIGDLQINLSGSPDDMTLAYEASSVTMVGGAIPVLPMHGSAQLKSGALNGHAFTNLPHTKDTPIDIYYRSKDGLGSAKIVIPKIIFDTKGLQPQSLVPLLRGKIAEVSGEVSAEFDFVFGGGKPVQSSGWADLKGLDIGTLVGPLSGVNCQLKFASIFPLKTDGIQISTLDGFDPSFPLKDGTIKFEIVPEGIKLHQAQWPIANTEGPMGNIFISPTLWRVGNVENLMTINVENVGLETVLAGVGKDKFKATGQVFGTLPTKINGVDILIDAGLLLIKDGGIIQYKNTATDAASANNENADNAFKALENFHYKHLEAKIDGPLDGALELKIVFDGKNPDVLAGQPFLFNTTITGELTNIARNLAGAFSNEENLSRIIEAQTDKDATNP